MTIKLRKVKGVEIKKINGKEEVIFNLCSNATDLVFQKPNKKSLFNDYGSPPMIY